MQLGCGLADEGGRSVQLLPGPPYSLPPVVLVNVPRATSKHSSLQALFAQTTSVYTSTGWPCFHPCKLNSSSSSRKRSPAMTCACPQYGHFQLSPTLTIRLACQ